MLQKFGNFAAVLPALPESPLHRDESARLRGRATVGATDRIVSTLRVGRDGEIQLVQSWRNQCRNRARWRPAKLAHRYRRERSRLARRAVGQRIYRQAEANRIDDYRLARPCGSGCSRIERRRAQQAVVGVRGHHRAGSVKQQKRRNDAFHVGRERRAHRVSAGHHHLDRSDRVIQRREYIDLVGGAYLTGYGAAIEIDEGRLAVVRHDE